HDPGVELPRGDRGPRPAGRRLVLDERLVALEGDAVAQEGVDRVRLGRGHELGAALLEHGGGAPLDHAAPLLAGWAVAAAYWGPHGSASTSAVRAAPPGPAVGAGPRHGQARGSEEISALVRGDAEQ